MCPHACRKLLSNSSLDMVCILLSSASITALHPEQSSTFVVTCGGVTSLNPASLLLSSSCLSTHALLHSPATEHTTWGFICEAKVSTNSGINSSTNLQHSLATILTGMKLHDPSNTSFSSSCVSLLSSWSRASFTISKQILQTSSLSGGSCWCSHTVWIQCFTAPHDLAVVIFWHQYDGPHVHSLAPSRCELTPNDTHISPHTAKYNTFIFAVKDLLWQWN